MPASKGPASREASKGPISRVETFLVPPRWLFVRIETQDGVTLRFTAETVEAAVRMLNCCSAMSSMLR